MKDGFLLEKETSFAGYLGIHIDRSTEGELHLLQSGLIERILKVMNLEESNPNAIPAQKKALGKDENGDLCKESWEYSSIVGMMMYLASTTRPDIAFAVHQCARFTHNPKRSHEIALKQIGQYLAVNLRILST